MKRKRLRRIYFAFSSLLICMVHLPMSFAKSVYGKGAWSDPSVSASPVFDVAGSFEKLYDSLRLNLLGLSRNAYAYAMEGLDKLVRTGDIENYNVVSIVDFSQPSVQKRFFVIDLCGKKVLFNTYVAHGQGSGMEYARQFSNKPSSFQSSLGFYQTTETYFGKHGYSLKLEGLERGINDHAADRAIVLHGAPYVSESYIRHRGILGRSQGCPAIPETLNRPIIEQIKNGTCLFIYGNDKRYLKRSPVLNS